MESVREAQRRRTQLLLDSPAVFHAQLERELNAFSRKCEKRDVTPLVRLNTASDLDWSATIRKFPEVQFYDYTASAKRAAANALGNYDITFSRKEVTADSTLRELLTMGVNVAIVFDVEYNPQHGKFGALPASWLGFPVVDGDKHDFRLREVDGHGVIVGLRLKGGLESKARARKTGFAVKP